MALAPDWLANRFLRCSLLFLWHASLFWQSVSFYLAWFFFPETFCLARISKPLILLSRSDFAHAALEKKYARPITLFYNS
ncbi:hypothetical protein EGK14_20620 [Erwinia sp. 198]|nr:hypothetical protein EGK14_20620 [Erwinia sp. 198]